MRHTFLLFIPTALATAAIIAACTSSEDPEAESVTGDGGDSESVIAPTTKPTTTPDAAPAKGPGTGLPCDVQGILENRCLACHGMQNPPPLITYENLTAKSLSDPTKTMAVVALELMKAKAMPPSPAVPPELDEIASFEDWVKAGTPRNPIACTDDDPTDGGVSSDAGLDAGDSGCTSGKFWTQGNTGSPLMHPGAACNACHQQLGGPNLRMAGTVYPSLREPIDCNGSAPPPPLKVIITDAKNKVFTLEVNDAGNFETRERPRLPIKAKITDGVKTRSMNGNVTSGDCNSCHTVLGAKGAPGRILAP